MAKMIVNLSKEEDKTVEMYRSINGLKSKQEALKQMVRYFNVQLQPDIDK